MLREVPRRTSTDPATLASSYASVALGYNEHLPAIYKELDQHRAAINTLPGRIGIAVDSAVSRAIAREREQLQMHLASVELKADEAMKTGTFGKEVVDEARRLVAQLDARAKSATDPLTPERAKQIAEEAARALRDGDELQGFRDSRAARRKFVWTVGAGVTVLFLGAVGGLVWHFLTLTAEHDRAYAAGIAAATTVQQQSANASPAPCATAESPAPPTSTTPAAVSPRHR